MPLRFISVQMIAVLAVSISTCAMAQQVSDASVQTVARAGAVSAKPVPDSYFTGSATLRPLANPVAPGRASFGEVTFAPGARSHWHTHPAGQTLYVLDGCGLTQQEGEPVMRICKGDTVYAPPGVKHWHGATATTSMTQLTVTETVEGRNVDWLEPVTDATYRAAEENGK